MLDNFLEKSASMGERRVRKPLKRQKLASASFPKRPFLGRVYPSKTSAGEKGKTKSYGLERGHPFLTVGFRTAAAANPIWLASFLENDNASRTRRDTRCRSIVLKRSR
jgi:hypothetical protein